MDVCMMKKDYRKLRKILCALDSDKYFYSCIQSDVEHVNPFGKFRLKEGGVETTDPRSKYFKSNIQHFQLVVPQCGTFRIIYSHS